MSQCTPRYIFVPRGFAPFRWIFLTMVYVMSIVANARAQRSVTNNLLDSKQLPEIRIHVAPELSYIGRFDFAVRDVAVGEAYLFGQSEHGKLHRAVLVDFEHFLPENDGTFDYPRLTIVKLGGEEYLHQMWALSGLQWFQLPEARKFLASHGLTAEPAWVMDRYVRVVDPEKKHEIIIVYLEAKSVSAAEVQFGGDDDTVPPPTPPLKIQQDIMTRASKAFQVDP